MDSDSDRPSAFPPTRWTLIARVAGEDAEQRQTALEEVCKLYWPPIYAYVRSHDYSRQDAEDLTQGFFADILRKNHFANLRSDRGKLRSYLLVSVKNFLVSEHRSKNRIKRGGCDGVVFITPANLDALDSEIESRASMGPDQLFDRLWAIRALEATYRRLEDRYRESGQASLFERLSPCIRVDREMPDQQQISDDLGISPAALRVSVHRLRQRYAACLREIVGDTIAPCADVGEELRYLISLFAR